MSWPLRPWVACEKLMVAPGQVLAHSPSRLNGEVTASLFLSPPGRGPARCPWPVPWGAGEWDSRWPLVVNIPTQHMGCWLLAGVEPSAGLWLLWKCLVSWELFSASARRG